MPASAYAIDPALTGIAIAYRNAQTIADQVFPRFSVGKKEFKFSRYAIGEEFAVPNTLIGRRGRARELELTGTESTGSVLDYGLELSVPQEDIDNAAGQANVDPLGRAVQKIADYVALAREVRVAAVVQDTGNYGADNQLTLSGSDQFSDAGSDPIATITASLDACMVRPNSMVLGRAAWSALRQHPAIVKASNRNAGDAGLAAKQAVAEMFELQNVYVGESFLNTAKPGQDAVMARVWGKDIALLFINPLADNDSGITFGWTAQWKTRLAQSKQDDDIGLYGGIRVKAGESVLEQVIANDAGFLLKNAVA